MERSEGEIVSDSKSEERHWKKVPFPGMYVNKCVFSYECSLLLRLVERDKPGMAAGLPGGTWHLDVCQAIWYLAAITYR